MYPSPVVPSMTNAVERYLAPSMYVDRDHPAVERKAKELARGLSNDAEIAERCFLSVRDEVLHSVDHRMGPVTLKASEVLEHRTGFCYAKSHLLAALLRANGISAGLCYQRLALDDLGTRFCLHGLNAVHLKGHGWYRVDARGRTMARSAPGSPRRGRCCPSPRS